MHVLLTGLGAVFALAPLAIAANADSNAPRATPIANAASLSPTTSPVARGTIRGVSIIPRSTSACPGEVIAVRYEAQLADGSRRTLSRGDLSSFERSGTAVKPRDDGDWTTAADPLASVVSGFKLHIALRADTSVSADTIIAPSYGCGSKDATPLGRSTANLSVTPRSAGISAHVRLGVFRTPFHDSIVVAALELPDGPPRIIVLGPTELRAGAISISASGRAGVGGRSGRPGERGAECESGADGSDGEDGSPGTPGGQVNLIVQADALWLADLVRVSNQGGAGGAGGRGGAGGAAGQVVRSARGPCSPRQGRPGRAGHAGPDGISGFPPEVTRVPFGLLWSGAIRWQDEAARTAIEQLIEYSSR